MPLLDFKIEEFLKEGQDFIGKVTSSINLSALLDSDKLQGIFGEAAKDTLDTKDYFPLNVDYERRRRRLIGDKRILRSATDRMYQLLVSGEAFSFHPASKNEIEVGITDPIALFHQIGAGRLPKDQDARHVIERSDRLLDKLYDELSNGLTKALQNRFK